MKLYALIKSFPTFFAAAWLLASVFPKTTLGADIPDSPRMNNNTETAVARLDQLVGLTNEQKIKAERIFAEENAALDQFTTTDDRVEKGAQIRQKARAEIRAILTPHQQNIYDVSPQRLGGGARQDPAARTARIDRAVTLTSAQARQINAIFQDELESLQMLSLEERSGPKSAEIRQKTKGQVRALLTPEQLKKYDDNPAGAQDPEVKAYIENFFRNSPTLATRLGTISQIKLAGGGDSTSTETVAIVGEAGAPLAVSERTGSSKGRYRYNVIGSARSEMLTVSWEKPAASSVKIIKIEDSYGEILSP